MNTTIIRLQVLTLSIVTCFAALAESQWEAAIQRFEAEDAKNPPEKGGIVFVGSSSIRMWNTEADFPDLNVINRGFGGSQTADSVEFAHRIVIPYEPRIVVLYAGDNDIAAGKSPDEVVADTRKFFGIIREALPDARIVYVAVKPSLARWNLVKPMREVNTQVKEIAEQDEGIDFADIDTPMLGKDGKPREELFIQDGLHLSREGYDLWNEVVRPLLEKD